MSSFRKDTLVLQVLEIQKVFCTLEERLAREIFLW